MTHTRFNMGATKAAYTSRPAVWIPTPRLATDGMLTGTGVKADGTCDGPHTYGVVRDGDRVTVWRVGECGGHPALAAQRRAAGLAKKPYVVTVEGVTATGCSCRAGYRGCKHRDSVAELVRRKLI